MSRSIVLDTGPLGMVTHPKGDEVTQRCAQWFHGLLSRGATLLIPEIADYELRRELLRAERVTGITRLDHLKKTLGYLPLTTETMAKAAELWAAMRRQGTPTADDKALDGDVILCAQAIVRASITGEEIVVATTNVGHLSRMTTASLWEQIRDP